MEVMKRKGARSVKDIPREILIQLNNGEIETANLVEWLAVDQCYLLKNLLIQHDRLHYLDSILTAIAGLKKKTVNTVNEMIGVGLYKQTTNRNDLEFQQVISHHTSDLVRCWGTYMVGRNSELSVESMLQKIQAFAADSHFGVREIAWLAVRPVVSEHLDRSLVVLSEWATHEDENIRRFASEVTRPRGVWCTHIERLKENPELGLVILTPMKSDPSKYVQDSVGNWLNDASKTKPDFVRNLCAEWEKEIPTKETAYIVKKALRTIIKQNQ